VVQIAFLLAAVFLLTALQQLRAVLALVFARVQARPLPAGMAAPPATAELFAAAHSDLSALGFDGPHWFFRETDYALDSPSFRIAALYRHPQTHAVVCLGAMPLFQPSDQLSSFIVTRLSDGSHAVTQAFDAYMKTLGDVLPDLRARAVAPATLRDHYQAHVRLVIDTKLGADAAFAEPDALIDLAGNWLNRQHDALLARRHLWRDREGRLRASFPFALRMLLNVWRRPKLNVKAKPVDAARIGLLAVLVERVRERVPPASVQWLLFGVSAILFAVVGAVVWDPRFAVLLLGVIGFHELGHYLAMRAFGYRNVHMLALPLIGGVTIGHETQPSAARRAWMSLMGPLPGILLGWALLLSGGPFLAFTFAGGWQSEAAMLLLTINYINLLPIPPLDGGRVIQAMLPARWHGVQAGFIAVACVGGGVAALWAGMTVIALLALLQLNGLPQLLQNGRVLKVLLADGPLPSASRQLRLRRVLDVFERVAGKSPAPKRRIAQAEAVLYSAEQPPMGVLQRIVLGGVLLLVLGLPLGVVATLWQTVRGSASSPAQQQRAEQMQRDQKDLENRVHSMSLAELAAAVSPSDAAQTGAPPAGASDADLQAAQTRLGRALPAEVADVLRVRNGIEAIGLGPAAQIGPAELTQLKAGVESDTLEVWFDGAPKSQTVPFERAQRWVRLNVVDPDEGESQLYYDDADAPVVPGHRLIVLSEGEGRAYSGLRALLEESWTGNQEALRMSQRVDSAAGAARERLRDASTEQLLAQFPQPPLLTRLLVSTPAAAPPANPAQIAAAERRLGSALPPELVELYRLHDGMRRPPLLPLAQLQRFTYDDEAAKLLAPWMERLHFTRFDAAWHATPDVPVKVADLDGCLAFGAPWSPSSTPEHVTATDYWCASPERWISLRSHGIYPSLHAWLVDQAARQAALE
jgi:Zn-dependent protease/cell wall assembly regulator SMI1